MQLVVLAAGRGTRLRPVTTDRSKAMVPVCGTPLVELALRPWIGCGLREAVFVVGPDDEEIRGFFGPGNGLGIEASFVEQPERRGMAHALQMAAPHLDGDFALIACDSLIDAGHAADLVSAHQPGSAVLSLMDVADELVSRSAAVELDGERVRSIVEKPAPGEAPSNTVSLPHYILPRRILELLGELEASPRGEIELQSGIQCLIDEGAEVVGVRTGSRRQVSNPEELRLLNLEMLSSEPAAVRRPTGKLGEGMVVRNPVRIEDGVTIGRDCVIGPNAYLESGAALGDGIVVRDAVVLRGARVEDNRRIEGVLVC